MRLLVTGGAGFIGSHFIRAWLHDHPNDHIVNLDLLTYAGDTSTLTDVERAHGSRYSFVQGDIGDLDFATGLLIDQRVDTVVNFASESHNSRAIVDPGSFVRTNVLGTQKLLEASRRAKVSRFHHVSTCEVYGDLPLDSAECFSEDSPYRPRTPYSASKASADLLVRAYHDTFKLPITISNCANNYGPCQHPEKVIPLFATNALDDIPLALYKRSDHRREWIHVEDHCRAIMLILERGRIGETYNVGTGDERSVEAIADAVLAATGRPATLKTYVADRPGHDRRYLLDHAKITRELGWKPSIDFASGLRDTVRWYTGNRAWWEPKRARIPDERAWESTAG